MQGGSFSWFLLVPGSLLLLPYMVGGQGSKLIVNLQNHQFNLLEAPPEEAFVRRTLMRSEGSRFRIESGLPKNLAYLLIIGGTAAVFQLRIEQVKKIGRGLAEALYFVLGQHRSRRPVGQSVVETVYGYSGEFMTRVVSAAVEATLFFFSFQNKKSGRYRHSQVCPVKTLPESLVSFG
ncbi:uncharacterized protein LOC113851161 [Abrus precatorius]|uniref:Uncharacterized protein LOC113851161 n=1 Tax=Abrus precatorius TaxID=3816 RepID=A0A8B8K1C3_ABRPR|nr:uncharacterized protein LOC113851161 [Abrus precatorius]